MPAITFTSLKNENFTYEITSEQTNVTLNDAKKFLHDTQKTTPETSDYKLVHKGSILQDNVNLADTRYHSDKIVFMLIKRKQAVPTVTNISTNDSKDINTKDIKDVKDIKDIKDVKDSTTSPTSTTSNMQQLNTNTTTAPSRPIGVPNTVTTTSNLTTTITPQQVAKLVFNQAVALLLSTPQSLANFLMIDPTMRQTLQSNPQFVNTIMSMQFITEVYSEITRFCGEVPRLSPGVQLSFAVPRNNTVLTPTSSSDNNTDDNILQTTTTTSSSNNMQPLSSFVPIEQDNGPLGEWLKTLPVEEKSLLQAFTKDQKTDIMNLCGMGFDFMDVVQVYPACGFDVNLTVEQLNNME